MDNFRRIALYVIAAVIGFYIILAWDKEHPTKQQPQTAQATQQSSVVKSGAYVPQSFNPASIPDGGKVDKSQKPVSAVPLQGMISVTTKLFQVGISPEGGNVVTAKLLKFPVSVNQPHTPIQILNTNDADLYVTRSGLTETGSNEAVRLTATQDHYELKPGQKSLTVTLNGHTANGLNIKKTFTFTNDNYAVTVKTTVTNHSSKTWDGSFYHQIVRRYVPVKHPFFHRQSYSGGAVSTHKIPYDQLSFKSMADKNFSEVVKGGWVAMQQPYFLTTWVPPKEDTSHFYSHSQGDGDDGKNNVFTLGYVSPKSNLAPSKTITNNSTLYVGPELTQLLNPISPTLKHTVDMGWLAPVSIFLFWIMSGIHAVIGNWGWSIILITLLIKLVFYPLSDKSYKSMAKMREAQPRIKQLQDRYGDDKQALHKATAELYKREKLNPVGGCLPMLIQIPVFFALYYVLMESVQLRMAPWILWIHDLSVMDPYYILPVLMGISMFVQQKLSPPPPDPTQAKVMLVMPVMFTVFFLWFPAGLVLYWLTNNVLSLIHQWYVMKTFDPKKAQFKRDKRKKK